MRESDLRCVLLVKAIEETDRDGTVVTLADRASASREARRVAPPREANVRLEAGRLPPEAQRLLVGRARVLLQQIRVRHPFVQDVLSFAFARWIGIVVLFAAFLAGIALSALDGTRRINVLAFPLWGVVGWNLVVYGFVLVSAFAALSRAPRVRRPVASWLAGLSFGRVGAVVARSRRFHAPLADALARFVAEWQAAARPILAARAVRLFHLAAAILGLGLVAGFYLRGLVLDYRAGWESTFLDADRAYAVLRVLYAPAAAMTGIAIPDAAHLQAIRWRDAGGGENAAPWIHLLAATTVVFVVVPRLVLALVATIAIARASRSPPLPATLPAYFAEAFRDAGITVDATALRVVPYAYDPSPEAIARLSEQVRNTEPHARLDVEPMVAYGAEDAFARALGSEASPRLLLFTLAATPEDENHGRVIDAAREAAQRTQQRLDVVVDEGPYARRLGNSVPERIDERRRAWRRFVAAHGAQARFVDLSR